MPFPRRFAPAAFAALLALTVAAVAPSSAGAFTRCGTPRGSHDAPRFAATHPRVLVSNPATLSCLQSLLTQQAPSATRFKNWVDGEMADERAPGHTVGEAIQYDFQPWYPALLAQVTGSADYCSFAVQSEDHGVAAEEALIASGQRPAVASDSYLDVGGYMANAALVYDWCYASLSASQRSRWIAYMNQAVWNVWHPDTATWGGNSFPWSGWSINNPSNNYYYSFLRATMLVGLATRGENPQAQTWTDTFRTTKIQNELLPTFNRDLSGGGSREGTGYGTAMRSLFELYDWWERSTGERIADLTPHTRQSLSWMTNAIVPSLDRIVSVGDQARDSSASLFDYHREYLLAGMSLFAGTPEAAAADNVLARSAVPRMGAGFEYWVDYLYEPAVQAPISIDRYSRTFYTPGAGLLTTRGSWTDTSATSVGSVCGPFTEGHAHQEQGSFQLFAGEWLAPTGNRYSHGGLQTAPEMHNGVRFVTSGGADVSQSQLEHPCTLNALNDAGAYVYASMDVTPAYASTPAVAKAQREFIFVRPNALIVFDRVQTTAGTSRIWTLNLQGAPSSVSGDHLTYLGNEHTGDRLDVDRVSPTGLSYQVSHMDFAKFDDTPLDPTGDPSRRVDVTATSGTESLFLHVLTTSTNGSAGATSVAPSNAAGMTGVSFTLADGRSVTARFSNASHGGTLSVTPGASSPAVAATLVDGVDPYSPFSSASPDLTSGLLAAGPASAANGAPATATGTGAGAGTGGSDARWAVAPKLRGTVLTLKGTFVKPGKPNTCPKTAKVAVKTKGKAVASGTVKLSRDRDLCKVTRGTLKLTEPAKSLSVRISGKGVKARTWATVKAAK